MELSLRDSEDSRYIGLAMPRFLARLPYGARTNPVDEFEFEEETDRLRTSRVRAGPTRPMRWRVNINRSFKHYGWCTSIRGVESGGAVENLPCHTFPTDDGGVDMKCPTEIAISRPPRGRARQERLHAADAPQELRLRGLHRCAVAAAAGRVLRPRRHGQRQPVGAPALPVRLLPLRALPEVHRARQDRLVPASARTWSAGSTTGS